MSSTNSRAKVIISVICLLLALLIAAATLLVFRPYYYENIYIAPIPTNLSTGWSNAPEPIFSDFYVSANAAPNGDGSLERPFATIEQAKQAIRKLKKDQLSHAIVAIMAGTYDIGSIEFTNKDSGTEVCRVIYAAYGDGEVIFKGSESSKETDAIININGARYIAFSGITLQNTAGCAIKAKGSNIDISSCTVRNTGGNGIEVNGTLISVNGCNISCTGKSAIVIDGGDRKSLTPGNCSADNNLISDTSKADVFAASVIISGTGNAFTNNEIINSPSVAVYYSGNANKIEYNYIHNTCLANIGFIFAVDSPDRWDCYGNFVRYNLISTIGNGNNSASGIHACSGTQVRGNMLINIKDMGISMSGRDINFTNNILVNCTKPLNYYTSTVGADNAAWEELKKSPYKSEAWKSAFPDCASLKTDYADMADPLFAANPANSLIKDNIILQANADIGTISAEANNYSNIGDNMVLRLNETDIFIDAKGGNYRYDPDSELPAILPEYRDIPFDSIGRY